MHSIKRLFLVTGMAASLSTAAAHAATLCVNTHGADHCYDSISDAVAAAAANDTINVGPGTYHEYVIITKPLSLTGFGATIDATGLSRGIFVNGMAAPKLAQVHIAGFTVQKANFEGILIANASVSSVSDNVVINNNRSLTDGTCPNIESFEPGEQMDCGEGIHLLGADHIIVTNNIVHGNSGGILLSDDTGATHDNLISFNTVTDNPFACGIVMASHVQSAVSGSMVPLGVFHNTIYGNHSEKNGYSAGGGAGIGIFASIPGAATYGNVVVNNYLNKNGHPGISLHAHAPNQNLTNNMLIGNTIVDNGADTADAATPGPTGINVFSVVPATGNIISGNSIQRETNDVAVNVPVLVQVQFNNLLGQGAGVNNLGAGPVDAVWNWWGCPHGPESHNCSNAEGANVISSPWLQLPAPVQRSY
jgi:parallel beta-helix repeat protein